MRCPACSTDNPVGNRYCENCGAQIEIPCPKCSHKNPPTALFCGACGTSFNSLRRSGRGGAPAGLPVLGELKQATVLFVDMVSSTELVASLDPEQAMERLRPAVAAMCDAVARFDGTVMQTLGDGIMALFGAPRAQEGHALLACEAALAMQEAFPPVEGGVRVRVGLHSGEIVFDAPGRDLMIPRGAHGLTIHLASRLQALAEPGGICITEDCYRLIRVYCDAEPFGRHALKGVPEPVEIYRLIKLKPVMMGRQFGGMNLTSFRGRDDEMERMQRALRAAEDGATSVIGVAGEPGTGKSRLCYEFAEWCRSRLIPVYEARAQIYGHATPLQPVLEFLRLFFHILPTDDATVARDCIAERLSEVGPTFKADLALLCQFLGVPCEEGPSWLNSKARRARLLDIIRHMVRRNGAASSVIIIEDLHWLDDASEEFVTTVVDAVAGTRTMLVLNYRPAYTAPWMQLPYYQHLVLADLNRPNTDALVEELMGDGSELRDIRRRVAERSDGNPFFVEELVRSLAENGALLGEPGGYTLGMKTGERTLPVTVQAVIGARIDRLGEAERALLQIGAIIGKEIPLEVLERVADLPSAEIEAGLDRLCEAEMIQLLPAADGRWYAFRHPLIQEVAYGAQLKARRSALHGSVAEAMERFHKDRLDEFAGLLAHHYEAAGQSLAAANYAARAARWVGSTNSGQAIKHWQKVRLLLRGQPRAPEIDTLRIMASSQISWLGWREGLTTEEARPYIEEALGWAREIDDTMVPLLMFVEARLTGASGGPADNYATRVREALSLLKPGRDAGRAATLNASLSQAYGWAGLFKEALAANDAALAGLPSIEKFDHQFLGYSVEHWVKSLRGRILVHLGRFDEAQKCFEEMLSIEQALIDPTVQFIAHLGYVDIAWCRADAALAAEHAARVAAIAERHGSPYLRVFAYACAGTAKGIAKDFAGATIDFSDGLAFMQSAKAARDYEADMLAAVADCHYRTGDFQLAIEAARKAIAIARNLSARIPECRASITYAAALLAQHGAEGFQEAEALFDSAEALIRQSGATVFERLLTEERARLSTLVR